MEKIVLYGAGNYCRLLLKGNLQDQYEILKIVDGDTQKWNTYIDEFKVAKPEELDQLSYDKVIISAKEYKSIAEKLIEELCVPEDKIFYVNFDNNNQIRKLKDCGTTFRHGIAAAVEKSIFRRMACETICDGLLFECLQNGEFENYNEVAVAGTVEQLQTVERFFVCMKKNAPMVRGINWEEGIKENTKYILTDVTYSEDLMRLRQNGCRERQWVIIPLYDVEDTVIV